MNASVLCEIFQCRLEAASLPRLSTVDSLVRGKIVAIIGKAGELLDNDYSGILETCDTIVRCNPQIENGKLKLIDKVLANTTGRTDLVYTSGAVPGELVPGAGVTGDKNPDDTGVTPAWGKALKRVGTRAVVFTARFGNRSKITDIETDSIRVKRGILSTGGIAVRDIIERKPAKLYIVGMDAALGKTRAYADDGHLVEAFKKAGVLNRGQHQMIKELQNLWELWRDHPDVVVPSNHLMETFAAHKLS